MSISKEGYKILIYGFIVLLVINIIVAAGWHGHTLFKWAFGILSLMF